MLPAEFGGGIEKKLKELESQINVKADKNKSNAFDGRQVFNNGILSKSAFTNGAYNVDSTSVLCAAGNGTKPGIGFYNADIAGTVGTGVLFFDNDGLLKFYPSIQGQSFRIAYKHEIPTAASIAESVIAQIEEQYELVRKH